MAQLYKYENLLIITGYEKHNENSELAYHSQERDVNKGKEEMKYEKY